jgi:WS/DGAT/MGAT family acyltransferase
MERLAGIDASFLYMETPTAHMHTIKVAILRPVPGVDYSIERVKADLRVRMHLLPPFRRRLVEVPLGFHHPVWIEDPAFDLAYHVRRAAVPSPGGAREMDGIIGLIASTPLDRRRPLWELWILEGLADGRVAGVAKIHHAVADGVAVAGLLANVMAPGLADLSDVPPGVEWTPELIPSSGRLLRDALGDHVRQAARLPALLWRTGRNLAAVARRRRTTPVAPPLPIRDAPRTSLNGSLTARRAFVSTAVALDDVRTVRDAFGVTLNDVFLAAVAGALRVYLAARCERPALPLVAEVPVAPDAGGGRRLSGNRLSNIFTSLCTDVEDPVERLYRICDMMKAAKEFHEVLGPDLFASWIEYAPPRPTGWWMRLYAAMHLVNRHRPPINVIVSCVPGPRAMLAWSGGTLEAIYSVGPIIEGTALNFTAWSYVDRLCIGTLACPDLVPDLERIVRGLHDALAELVHAATRARPAESAASSSPVLRPQTAPMT